MSRMSATGFRRKALCTAIMAASMPGLTVAQSQQPVALEPLEVSAEREAPSSEQTRSYVAETTTTTMKMGLTHRETPQSVTVVTREQMDDFARNDINDLLEGTTGVTVESVETDRTYYTARGFDINNFQYDGVGLPAVYDNVQGELDTAFFDRVEVVRGANGLMTGSGNPSATVNFIRKRPTADTQAPSPLPVGPGTRNALLVMCLVRYRNPARFGAGSWPVTKTRIPTSTVTATRNRCSTG
ncbi:TonB-dependent siderophore receptor [Marinobacter similis]|uniref:TonB-dependent siderophore receptor n=1 Tax=Marinobacter similis TaxID=1420916 RepID=UPI000A55B211|nr:TonB-dependent receptor plug domain-containing protein [Marinobacter similis]